MFYDRRAEKARLTSALQRARRQFVVLYGRRRCGKSTLLRNVLRPTDVYFLATQTDRSLQVSQLAERLAERYPPLTVVAPKDWDELFGLLLTQPDGRFTLVLDEFPYLVRADPSLPSIIQRLLDDRANLPFDLIVCGSSQQMMQGVIMSSTAPLYGRADEIIKIEPLPAGYLKDHLPHLPAQDLMAEYATWGGVPRYWELRANYPDYDTAVNALVLSPDGVLRDEPTRLLLDDIRETAGAASLLFLIANGVHRPSELGGRLGKPATDLSRPLARLVELGYVYREVPYGAKAKQRKGNLYKVADPFVRFYYRYVHPNLSRAQLGRTEPLWKQLRPTLPGFVGEEFERLARWAAPLHQDLQADFFSAERWWGKDNDGQPMEVDLVGESVDGTKLLVGECKWSEVRAPDTLQRDLMRKATRLPFYRGQEIIPVLIGKRFAQVPNCCAIDAELLFDLARN